MFIHSWLHVLTSVLQNSSPLSWAQSSLSTTNSLSNLAPQIQSIKTGILFFPQISFPSQLCQWHIFKIKDSSFIPTSLTLNPVICLLKCLAFFTSLLYSHVTEIASYYSCHLQCQFLPIPIYSSSIFSKGCTYSCYLFKNLQGLKMKILKSSPTVLRAFTLTQMSPISFQSPTPSKPSIYAVTAFPKVFLTIHLMKHSTPDMYNRKKMLLASLPYTGLFSTMLMRILITYLIIPI